ncbi:MAG: hypothetical protein A2Y79_06735 [Deltaproteobacteria bacterium RBG_13_43_22]|nr:MAG: hypothetical protein A2Y79_06735 [Deltaproteobacteria bacterium RBG_13_43_22]
MSKYIPWEELKIGNQYGPLELPYIERYFTCEMDELGPIHTKESPWGGPVYPAMYMGTLLGLRMIGSQYDSHATVPARLSQKNINPAKLDKKLFLSGLLVDKYIKRGLEYAAIKTLLIDEDGHEIRQTTDHFLLSLEKRSDVQEVKGLSDIAPLEDLKPGHEIPSFTRTAYQRALDEFPFLDDSSHKDAYARTKGYPAALLSGYVLCGYLSKYFEDFFGPAWFTGGEIELAFIKAVHQKQTITIRASVSKKIESKEGTSLILAFCIQQADGLVNVKGKASGIIKH